MATYQCFLLLVVMAWGAHGQMCADYYLSLSLQERLQKAEIVLFGIDVSPSGRCQIGDADCRQIQFRVECILKNPGYNITRGMTITIGNRTDVTNCDGTYFTSNAVNDEFVVLIKAEETYFEWDEVIPGEPAKVAAQDVWDVADQTCGLMGSIQTGCPVDINSQSCQKHCGKEWKMVGDKCVWVGVAHKETLQAARNMCNAMNSDLVTLSTSDAWDMLKSALPAQADGYTWWTGGSCVGTGSCSWLNHWSGVNVNNVWLSGVSGDGHVVFDNENYYLESVPTPVNKTHFYVCERAVTYAASLTCNAPALDLGWVCCDMVAIEEVNLVVDSPMGATTAHAMAGPPSISTAAEMQNANNRYTVVLFDHTDMGKLIYWLVVNVPMTSAGDLTTMSGSTWLSYKPPLPWYHYHLYSLIVFKQQQLIEDNRDVLQFFSGNCSGSNMYRCNFNLCAMLQYYSLYPVVDLPFKVQVDEYSVKQLYISYGATTAHACQLLWPDVTIHKEKYAVCPVPSGATTTVEIPGLLFLLALFIYTMSC